MTPPDVKQLLKSDPEIEALLREETPWGRVLRDYLTVYPPLVELKENIIPRFARVNTPILILGESGTGKEMIARSLHGERPGKFVAVSCCSIPSELLESEFFGAVKGAYTGAINNKDGYVKEAENGTLFLDEIGDMPSILQGKLLRLLENREYRRVGDTKTELANFRLITATNRFEIRNGGGGFRRDLFHRIAGYVIKLPSLMERGNDDIRLIVDSFAGRRGLKEPLTPQKSQEISIKIMEHLTAHKLDGNIRELLNIIESFNVLNS